MAVNLKPQQKMSDTEILSRMLTSSYQYVVWRLIQLPFAQRFTHSCWQEMILQRSVFCHKLVIRLPILISSCTFDRNSLSWAIYALCKDTSTQSTLRAEIISFPTDTPTFDELNSLPYLDAVVRETLRLYAPIAGTSRVAQRDCVLPMAEGWTDTKGVKHDSIL